ncbi:protein of unknown function [Taphrina deformans PYCC 5710]|uniref:2Fe-2S ferredoxin-type domain-containing protein n=1 Tax=Taphrina deformans (strain PYCC 5710 / ATCC 11124 / CBS 356.35 / IMI 108563 / JCM 9778 / NBRC 8474) TaxID=1097556 RepID=R4XHC0_TAPDE|nr:protein of unknown function [Taphrina deformans PYCC 5710]|eukprot:CCG83928.1 protein of unknown function [Taphrina deformans PYCC 5710]
MFRTCLRSIRPIAGPHAKPLSLVKGQFQQNRTLFTTPVVRHKHIDKPKPGEEIKVTFILQNGEHITLDAPAGASILDVAHENDVELEGACEGSVACSTCHVIVDPDHYEKLEEPTDEENDMLDLAFGLEETSRLGCQVILDKSMSGITVKLPSATRNIQHQRPNH